MSDLMLLGSFLAGTFEFTLEALGAVSYCLEAYLWLLVLTLLVASGIIFGKDSEEK